MASGRLKKDKKAPKFLSEEQSRTIKPANFKQRSQLKDLSNADLVELLCQMEAELQAKEILLNSTLVCQPGTAFPLSHLLNDSHYLEVAATTDETEAEDVWLGEPSAHLNHVVAYHQVVAEHMESILGTLRDQHKQIVVQLDEERQKYDLEAAQGDDVTYMLEKERERLQQEIEIEQAKCKKLEKECDKLGCLLVQERNEQLSAYNELMHDCKALGRQTVEQVKKIEQLQKDVEKEKQKNVLLTEYMLKEGKHFKEKLKMYDDDFQISEQRRVELEKLLFESECKIKDLYTTLHDEQRKNKLLQFNITKLCEGFDVHHDADINDELSIVAPSAAISDFGVKKAVRSQISLSDNVEPLSPEPVTAIAQPSKSATYRVATVQKSNTVKQGAPASPSSQNNQRTVHSKLLPNNKIHIDRTKLLDPNFPTQLNSSPKTPEFKSRNCVALFQTPPIKYNVDETRNVGSVSNTPNKISHETDNRASSEHFSRGSYEKLPQSDSNNMTHRQTSLEFEENSTPILRRNTGPSQPPPPPPLRISSLTPSNDVKNSESSEHVQPLPHLVPDISHSSPSFQSHKSHSRSSGGTTSVMATKL